MPVASSTCAIIIPCYNAAKFLPATIASVSGQTRPPQEIILVDDGSIDESAEVTARIAPFVRIIRQANQGESVARKVGLRAATSDYVPFLDADDLLAPGLLRSIGFCRLFSRNR
jgi:glycosyltransferase involved in cell wall biosynthesis